MRLFITNLLATALVLFSAASASANSLHMTSDAPAGLAPVGTLINVSVYFTATTTGVQLLSTGILFDNTILQYNPIANASVGVPSYILYGMTAVMPIMVSQLDAQQSTWLLWPGTVPAGQSQVNINWADPTFFGTVVTNATDVLKVPPACATGTCRIGVIQFAVIGIGDGLGEIEMSISAGGNIFQVAAVNGTPGDPNSPITLSGSPINVITPEPTTAVLVGLGLLGLGVAGRRR